MSTRRVLERLRRSGRDGLMRPPQMLLHAPAIARPGCLRTTSPERLPHPYRQPPLPGFFLGLACGAVAFTWIYKTCRNSVLAAGVWHGCYNLAAASQAARERSPRSSPTTIIMVWATVLVVLEVRAKRRGASILAAWDDRGPGARSAQQQ